MHPSPSTDLKIPVTNSVVGGKHFARVAMVVPSGANGSHTITPGGWSLRRHKFTHVVVQK
jgi:hypothetical protein